MGFSREFTFNNLCGSKVKGEDESDPHSCKKPSHWKLDDSVREEMENEQRQSTHQKHHREL